MRWSCITQTNISHSRSLGESSKRTNDRATERTLLFFIVSFSSVSLLRSSPLLSCLCLLLFSSRFRCVSPLRHLGFAFVVVVVAATNHGAGWKMWISVRHTMFLFLFWNTFRIFFCCRDLFFKKHRTSNHHCHRQQQWTFHICCRKTENFNTPHALRNTHFVFSSLATRNRSIFFHYFFDTVASGFRLVFNFIWKIC